MAERLRQNPDRESQDPQISLLERMKANAILYDSDTVTDILQQYEDQADKTKVDIKVAGYAHIMVAMMEVLKLEDPEINEVRIPNTVFQAVTEEERVNIGEGKVGGDLPVESTLVQKRLTDVYALLGAERKQKDPEQDGLLMFNLISKTALGPNIYAYEEHSPSSVAIKVVRTDKNPLLHRTRDRNTLRSNR